jgi:signal transduction histidine kinase
MAEDLARSREALLEEAEKRLRVERDLRHFERMATLGQLTSNLAHEVGTPLGVLRGRAECLASEFSDRPEARREVESIIAQIDRITRTIERYLSASRPSPATAERVVGDDLVREAAALVDLECRRHGIELEVKPAAGEAAILGHRDGLMQVLLNLAVNGIQSMESGGALRLASRPGELRGTAALELEVSDTGPGISEEVQKRIFEPFYSTRGTTGLGLFISRSIVREHGGATAVESEPGGGSTFLVRIPLVNGDGDGDGDGDKGGSGTVTKGGGEECPPGMS